jgi:hypothetical protein
MPSLKLMVDHTTRVLRIIDLDMKVSSFISSSVPVQYFSLSWTHTVKITDKFCDSNCCCTLAWNEGLIFILYLYGLLFWGGGRWCWIVLVIFLSCFRFVVLLFSGGYEVRSIDYACTDLLTYLRTYVFSPWSKSSFRNWQVVGYQDVSHILWNPKVYYRIHKYPPPVPIQS